MIAPMTTLHDRLECGSAMRAHRIVEGLLLASSFVFLDLRPVYVVVGLSALQVISPVASPIVLLWLALDRRVPTERFGNIYFDRDGFRGAAALACMTLTIALALIRWSSVPLLGRLLIALPTASTLLAATVNFCAGCSHYALGRDLLARMGLVRRTPQGACDVDFDD